MAALLRRGPGAAAERGPGARTASEKAVLRARGSATVLWGHRLGQHECGPGDTYLAPSLQLGVTWDTEGLRRAGPRERTGPGTGVDGVWEATAPPELLPTPAEPRPHAPTVPCADSSSDAL